MGALQVMPISPGDPALSAALSHAGLPTDDLLEGGRTFYRVDADGEPVGFAGYELYGEDALLRSVVVLPSARGKGYGRLLTERVLARAHDAGARRAFLLTTTAEGFFDHIGFCQVARGEAPPSILRTKQASAICSTAPMLTRRLGDRG